MISRAPIFFWFLTLGITLPALASRVTEVSGDGRAVVVDQDEGDPWKNGDPLCVIHDGRDFACGKVVKSGQSAAVVELDEPNSNILEGDEVRLSGAGEPTVDADPDVEATRPTDEPPAELEPELAQNDDSDTDEAEKPTPEDKERFKKMNRLEIVDYHRRLIRSRGSALPGEEVSSYSGQLIRRLDLTVGAQAYGEAGGQSIWPHFNAQVALTREYSLAVMGSYYGFDVAGFKSSTIGAAIGVTYYGSSLYDGAMGTFGGGLGLTSADDGGTGATAISFNLIATVGYRWLIGGHFNLGLQGGAQIFRIPQIVGVTTGAATILLPMVMLDLGFAF